MVFPDLDARGLTGERYRLPEDFGAPRAVVAIAFHRGQQKDVDTWMPSLLAIEAEHDDVRAYEIPCISRRWTPGRRFIDGGMVAGIPDRDARARTLTTYTDVGPVLKALGLRDTGAIAVVLTDRDGRIAWTATGAWTADAGAALTAAV